jgi:EAL domain-containing protein (putative c-di-GMP-specific phosphodiesterase class I)
MRPRASIGAARLALRAATVATVVASAIAILGGPTALLADNIQELVALTGAAAGLGLACRHMSGATRWFLVALALSLAGATLGMLAWDLSLPGVGNALFVLGVAIGVAAIVPAIFGGLERGLLIGIATDALILFLTGVVLVASTTGHDFTDHTGLIGLVLLVATVAACAFALIGRRIRPAWGGPWTLISGAAFIGASWWMWSGDAAAPTTVGLSDFTFSAGVLLIAFGGMTWSTRASYSPRYERLAPMLATVIPAAAILASLATAAIYHGAAVRDLVGVATAAVIVTGVARQVHLYVRESRALAAEHRAGVGLAAEISERAATLLSLQRLTPGATLEETAQEVCREALQLDAVDLAVIRMYGPDDSVVPVAIEGLGSRAARLLGHPLTPTHAARVRARALDGSWERSWDQIDNPYQQVLRDLGIHRTVNAVLRWHDAIIGDIGLGTRTVESAVPLRDRLSTVEEFAVVASALLGPAKAERDHADAVRQTIRGVLEARSFHPVFQPIVDLGSRDVVGYEALTRFDSGQRPDLCFADAWSVGLGPELELATLGAAVDAARGLRSGVFLDLNASPRLLAHAGQLRDVLHAAGRPLVLEITEHETVEDYERLRDAIRTLGRDVRVAVDDAGAGVANFGHIIDLRPDFVKLDISLVRRVNANLGRQAMVVGMRHFSRTAGCRLIAEGVETPEEADTLTSLGVEFGQGYLFGRPEPIDAWVAADPCPRSTAPV